MMALMLPDELFDPLYDGEERADPEDIRLGLAVPDGWAHRRRPADGHVYGWHDHRQRQRDLDRLHNLSD